MSKALAFLKKEFVELLPPTIFFFVVFHVVVFARQLLGADVGLAMTTSAAASIGALVVGKAILIADSLPLFKVFRGRLIYNVIWRVFLFLGVVLVLQLIEQLVPLVSKYGGLPQAMENLFDEIHWARFWAIHILLGVFLTFYAFVTTLIGLVGREAFLDAFLGRKPRTSAYE